MQEVKVNGIIEADAEKVWELAGDFSRLDSFVEAIADCSSDGKESGAIRTLTLQDGSKVKEKLQSINHENHTLNYSIVESEMPIKNYVGTMQVKDLGNNRSEFTWSSEFRSENGQEEEMKQALEGLYSLGMEGLQNHFKSGG
ncbi:MAG TPA: SRPBCC family protein [Halalkalibaculum sp.]|nr:SRPBCC family protein [Halalkalibaculum sp.]